MHVVRVLTDEWMDRCYQVHYFLLRLATRSFSSVIMFGKMDLRQTVQTWEGEQTGRWMDAAKYIIS